MRRGLLASTIPDVKPANIIDLSSSSSSASNLLNKTQVQVSLTNLSTLSVDDDIDEMEFQQSIRDMANSIHEEMRSFGDAEENANDLRNVEFRIQSERIIHLMDACVENLQFGFVMPLLMADKSNLRAQEMMKRMPPSELREMEEVLSLLLSINTDAGLTHETLNDIYVELEGCLRAAAKCGLKEFIPVYEKQLPHNAIAFIAELRELRELTQLRIFWTAPKAMAKEKRLYAMWTENLVTKELVDELRIKVDTAQHQQKQKLKQNESILETYRKKVEELNAANDERIEKTIYESNLKMNKTTIDSEHKQLELLNRTNKISEEYDTMLRDNLASGKKLRENKLKMQQKLQSWLLKYDAEVGERSKELFQLKDQLEEERKQFKKWMIKYEEQEVEYLDVEAQILAEYLRIRDEKVRIFTMNYAARVVQRAFRKQQKRRKAARKKGKKGKKK